MIEENCVNTESCMKAESSTKIDAYMKAEPSTKIDACMKAESSTKIEACMKIEPSTKTEPHMKIELYEGMDNDINKASCEGQSGSVLVIAGTTESRNVIEHLQKAGSRIIASTATPFGADMLKEYSIEVHVGRLDLEGFLHLLQDKGVDRVMDASHPYARVVTETVQKACQRLRIPYERIERAEEQYSYNQIIYVSNTEAAIAYLNQIEARFLLTTGVKTLNQYIDGVVNAESRLYARILPQGEQEDTDYGILSGHIQKSQPPFTIEDNLRLLKQWECGILVTKDSGRAGGVAEKIEAAKRLDIPVLIIERPVMQEFVPRFLVAGTGSGCGKTTVTLAIMKAFANRKVVVQPYKCGPDYIDPMLHSHVTGIKSRNLDPFFLKKEQMQEMVVHHNRETGLSIAEGVMGFYDGIGMTEEGSTYSVSEAVRMPVVLVLSAAGISMTIAAILEGMINHRPNLIAGVLFNQCSQNLYEQLKPVIEEKLSIPVLGYLPKNPAFHIPNRHLGLMTAAEIEDLDQLLESLGQTAEQTVDLDGLLKLAQTAEPLPGVYLPTLYPRYADQPVQINEWDQGSGQVLSNEQDRSCKNQLRCKDQVQDNAPMIDSRIRIGVARDEAFCFYYEDNLEVLEELGAELVPFSPIRDKKLPDGICGLYLGGGYPELYASELAENQSLRQDIAQRLAEKMPVMAECGGYLYLCETLTDLAGIAYSMVGFLPVQAQMKERLNRHFGYVTIEAKQDGMPAKQGQILYGHEFHYSETNPDGGDYQIRKPNGRSWDGIYAGSHYYIGYPHLYFRSYEDSGSYEAAKRFIEKGKIWL